MSTSSSGGPKTGSHKPSARESAYEFIGEGILRGTFSSGEFLDETELAQAIGVSRTPVREALHRLRAERFINLLPRRGAQVRSITAVEMQEVYEARIVLEAAAFANICRNGRPIPSLAVGITAQMAEAGDAGDWPTFGQLDQQFHSTLVHSAGNSVLHHLYDNLRPQHIRIAIRAITESPHRLQEIQKQHQDLLNSLQKLDEESAISILKEHLRNVPEVVQALDA